MSLSYSMWNFNLYIDKCHAISTFCLYGKKIVMELVYMRWVAKQKLEELRLLLNGQETHKHEKH